MRREEGGGSTQFNCYMACYTKTGAIHHPTSSAGEKKCWPCYVYKCMYLLFPPLIEMLHKECALNKNQGKKTVYISFYFGGWKGEKLLKFQAVNHKKWGGLRGRREVFELLRCLPDRENHVGKKTFKNWVVSFTKKGIGHQSMTRGP